MRHLNPSGGRDQPPEPPPHGSIPRALGILGGVTGKAGEGTKASLPFSYTSAPSLVTVCLWFRKVFPVKKKTDGET